MDYDITVLPGRLPLAGHFAGNQELWPGLCDSEGRRLQRRDDVLPGSTPPTARAYVPLVCNWTTVKGVPSGGIALAVPTGSGWTDRLAYLRAGHRHALLAGGQPAASWSSSPRRRLPETQGYLPVVGDFVPGWIGQQLAFVGPEDESACSARAASSSRGRSRSIRRVGGEIRWPVRWNVGDRDGLALLDPAAGHVSWWSADQPAGSLACCFENAVPFDSRLPFWTFDSGDLSGFKVAVLVTTPEGLFVRENLLGFWGIRPTTYPLKFPDDPP